MWLKLISDSKRGPWKMYDYFQSSGRLDKSILNSRPNGCHFADNIFTFIFLKIDIFRLKLHWSWFLRIQLILCQGYYVSISSGDSLALKSNKPLSEPMAAYLTYMCLSAVLCQTNLYLFIGELWMKQQALYTITRSPLFHPNVFTLQAL